MRQLGSFDTAQKATETQAAGLHLLERTRRYGGRSVLEASRGYELQFRAAAEHSKEMLDGKDNGKRMENEENLVRTS